MRPYKTKRFFHLFLVSTLWHPYVNKPKDEIEKPLLDQIGYVGLVP